MKRILVPCDFSEPAVNAFRVSLTMAKKLKAEVHLLFVIELPVLTGENLMAVDGFMLSLRQELEGDAKKRFSSLIKRYSDKEQSVVSTVQFGLAIDTIKGAIAGQKYDLVIMGSHGASGMREFFIGSNAERIVRFSSVPVLVVKNYHVRQIKHIVFPYTSAVDHSLDFIAKVKALQNLFDAQIHIVRINTPEYFVPDANSLKSLDNFVKTHKFKNCTIQSYSDLNEVEGILHFSKTISADMIVMATHGRKGIAHLFQGSITENIVNSAPNLIWTYVLKDAASITKRRVKKELQYN